MKVRLKRFAEKGEVGRVYQFQFHEGPIKTVSGQSPDIQRTSFNSMKVRLKPIQYMMTTMLVWFQFHEGPIKTAQVRVLAHRLGEFQFHEGPIKTREDLNKLAEEAVSIP